MTEEETARALSTLVAATTGWNDEAVTIYVAELSDLSDAEALHGACRRVANTWTEARRPPLRTIRTEYENIIRSRQAPALPDAERPVSVPEGIEIARAAYEQLCREEGREPNRARFDKTIRSVVGK